MTQAMKAVLVSIIVVPHFGVKITTQHKAGMLPRVVSRMLVE